jgi:tetratricopeptide (TPR) repeat protein
MKKLIFLICAFFLLTISSFGQEFNITPMGRISIPVGEIMSQVYHTGVGAGIKVDVPLPADNLWISANAHYLSTGIRNTENDAVRFAAMGAGPQLRLLSAGMISIEAFLRGGAYVNFLSLNDENYSGVGASLSGGAGFGFKLNPALEIYAESGFQAMIGLYSGIFAGIGIGISPGGMVARPRVQEPIIEPLNEPEVELPPPVSDFEPVMLSGRDLSIQGLQIDPVLPVFKNFYEEAALGIINIRNENRTAIRDLSVTFFIEDVMNSPETLVRGAEIPGNGSLEIPIRALFNNQILEITQSTKARFTIQVEYLDGNRSRSANYRDNIEILHRNAMIWSDTDGIACFVTAMDTPVINLAKNMMAEANSVFVNGLDDNLQTLMAMFIALKNLNISYASDPTTPYAEFSQGTEAVDYIQFPVQTLSFRTGDCDDLTILSTAMLQSLGVQTAFVTVPGHIYIAVRLDLSPDQAGSFFDRPDNLIIVGNEVWLPFEITMLNAGFLEAWETGAREWYAADRTSNAELVPVQTAWERYAPVQLTDAEDLSIPAISSTFRPEFSGELDSYIRREIYERARQLEQRAQGSRSAYRAYNSLGVLYARFGLYEEARQWFRQSLSATNNEAAHINLGNMYYLAGEYFDALNEYELAGGINPDNINAQLGIARCQFELENYGFVKQSYDRVKQLDPAMAERYSYLELRSQDAARASDYDRLGEVAEWYDEE